MRTGLQTHFGVAGVKLFYILQGWKLQAVRLSETGKNRGRQVKILDTCPKERLILWKLLSVRMSRTGKNSARQVNLFDTFPKERLKYFVISTPDLIHKAANLLYTPFFYTTEHFSLQWSLNLHILCLKFGQKIFWSTAPNGNLLDMELLKKKNTKPVIRTFSLTTLPVSQTWNEISYDIVTSRILMR